MAKMWKEIPNTDGLYFASTDGRIKSVSRRGTSGGVLKPGYNRKGYEIITVCVNGSRVTKQVHGLIAKTFIPNPGNKPQVNHKNGIKDDNRVINLEWVTNKENRGHAKINGLVARGEDGGNTKLTESDVIEIRKRYKTENTSYKKLGFDYGVTHAAIGDIIRGETWNHI